MSSSGNNVVHNTRNNLALDVRDQMIELLNAQLADTFDLYSQTKQAHWNVRGMQFIALHELFDKLGEELEDFIDMIAERAVALGGDAFGTVRQAAGVTRIPDYPTNISGSEAHVEALAERYAAVAASTRQAITTASNQGDDGTADLFTEVVRGLDKSLWFLEAHLNA